MSRPTTQAEVIGVLLSAGYVTTAPACGDCAHCADKCTPMHLEPECAALVCLKFCVPVGDGGRCLHWEPDARWLAANPLVAPRYTAQPEQGALSPAELAYAHKDHTLTKPRPLPGGRFQTRNDTGPL